MKRDRNTAPEADDDARAARRRAVVLGFGLASLLIYACGGTSPVAPDTGDALREGETSVAAPRTTAVVPGPQRMPGPPVVSPEPTPVPPPPPPSDNPLVGSYAVTLEVGGSCSLPEEARIRHYAASIAEHDSGDLLVTLGGATFLDGLICTVGPGRAAGVGCNQFFASTSGDAVQFALENHNDDAHGSHIVERLPSGGWVEIIGNAAGSMSGGSVIATGSASVWYCDQSLPYPFPCSGPRGCEGDLTLAFTRR